VRTGRALCLVVVAGCGRLAFDETGAVDAPTQAANTIFVTSTTKRPDLIGSLAGADAMCMERAAAVGLQETFVAWMSTTTVDAIDRLGDARGWRRIDGLPFADTIEDIQAGAILYPASLDESGDEVGGWPPVATGTNEVGRFDPVVGTCGDWTTTTGVTYYGSINAASTGFTAYSQTTCSEAMHVYCMGIDRQRSVMPPPESGRKAFVAPLWTPGGGLASADAHCQATASSAGLDGTFKALLASSTGSAASRFDLQGPRWVRTDGILLADTATDFMAGRRHTGIQVAANGTSYFEDEVVWTGSSSTGSFDLDSTTAGAHCADWTTTSGSAGTGVAGDRRVSLFDAIYPLPCSSAHLLYCLET